MRLPFGAAFVLDKLTAAGYQAYVVGGCVRDSLLGKAPKDWDVCTSATPEEMQQVFRGCHVVETGLKHGTLTVVVEHEPYEVTTFRVDGDYTDHRHPDQVTFVTDVREDLARRDFTVNAMAYHPDTGVVDAFGGQADLAAGIIRCVGEAEKRFGEDALRILRALRFASVYGFAIEEHTAQAAHTLKETLRGVAAERIRMELGKLLCGQGAGDILRAYPDVLLTVLPWLKPVMEQHLWQQTVDAVERVPAEEVMRLAALLHPLEEDAVKAALSFLRVDNATLHRVTLLLKHWQTPVTREPLALKHWLHDIGTEPLRQLIDLQAAVKGTDGAPVHQALEALLAGNPCVTLRQLAVTGGDLMKAGLPKGPFMGRCLEHLLEQVMAETLPNEKDALLAAAAIFAQT